MRKEQVEVGAYYRCKVSGRIVIVRILNTMRLANGREGWTARNVDTGRNVTVRSAQRLRERVEPPGVRLSQ